MADSDGPDADGRRQGKSAAAFRTISEVASDLDVPPHVLRFWESKFSQVKPLKRGGGRRYYRPEDVDLLRGIRELLYTDGYTIKGVQKLLRDGGVKAVAGPRTEASSGMADQPAAQSPVPVPATAPGAPQKIDERTRAALTEILGELEDLRELLRA